MARAATAVYLYCVISAARRPSAARVPTGIPGGAVEIHQVTRSLWIAAGIVPLDVYGSAQLEARLRDLDWISTVAVGHEAVVEHFARARSATVIPMKLFTLFSTVDKAVHDVTQRVPAIRASARRIAGAQEWGVRVFRQRQAERPPRPGATASGVEFLRARKQARDAGAAARMAVAAAAERAYDALRRRSRDAKAREAGRDPGGNPPVLDAAFLVPRAGRARFAAEVRRQTRLLGAVGAQLVLNGPWPAYNFVTAGHAR